MHTDELWQIYAPNGEPISGAGWESAKDNPEISGFDAIVGVSVVFLYRFNESGVLEFLWQRRSDKVSRYPGYYDISAGGHINLGETLTEAACRECFEEIGAKITADDLKYVSMIPFNKNRFAWVYAVDWTGREEAFSFNDEEVSEVRWVPYPEMEEFWRTKTKPPLQKDKLTSAFLYKWLEMQGLISENN
ncbi:NUDIX domain-containing protein [Candidatus Saccharibacteria bacterium]|nr:NUDIX domain-containing protein [Candidatus Saccharibacteria bacterium]